MAARPPRSFGPRFSLRTLLVVMLLLGPLCAVGWMQWERWREWEAQRAVQLERQRVQAQNERIYARAMAALNNMYGGAALQPADDENRSDESFPESDPR